MNRLALALAAVLAGPGCIVVSDSPPPPCEQSVTVSWASSFRTADGALVGCTSSSAVIDSVDVWVDDVYVNTFACAAGAATVVLPPGSHLFTVEGFEGPARVYRDELTAGVSTCGAQLVVPVQPAEGRVNLDYAAATAPPCAGGPCHLWFSVRDDISTFQYGYPVTAAIVNASSVPTAYPYPDDVVFKLPAGSYTVEWMQVVSGGLSELGACSSPGFLVAPGSGSLPVGQQQVVPAAPVSLTFACR